MSEWYTTQNSIVKIDDNGKVLWEGKGEEIEALLDKSDKYDALVATVRKAKEALAEHYTFENNGTTINQAYNFLADALMKADE